MNILFLSPYPFSEAPSQRFRFEQYFKYLDQKGISHRQVSFLSSSTFRILYKEGFLTRKVVGVFLGFLKRFFLLFSIGKYDFVFIHREATPLGWPWVEWVIAKIWRKRIVYDFDDAIWMSNTSVSNKVVRMIKNHSKVKKICKWAHKISVGNEFLKSYASDYSKNVVTLPTTLLNEVVLKATKEHKQQEPIVIGWIGTHSTLKYLKLLEGVFEKLEKQYSIIIRVVSNKPPQLNIESLEFVKWSKEKEIESLLTFDIGVMPLPNTDWEKGKCSFKALQYMSLGIPAVVSPVGMNNEVIHQGENGYLCQSENEWLEAFERLITDVESRAKMGMYAKEMISKQFTDEAQKSVFLGLFS